MCATSDARGRSREEDRHFQDDDLPNVVKDNENRVFSTVLLGHVLKCLHALQVTSNVCPELWLLDADNPEGPEPLCL